VNTNKNNSNCQTVARFSVYAIWCQCTDKFYVGVTSQKNVYTRIRQHKKGKQFIDKQIKEIGWEGNFDWWVVEEDVPSNQISEREQHWVELFNSVHPNGYNKTCGGISKLTVSDDTRKKIRQNALARDISGEKNPHYGKKHTEEAKEKIRQARLGKSSWNKGIPCSDEQKEVLREKALARDLSGEKNPFYGKHHTKATKEKNRQAHLGKPSARKGEHHTEETKAILRAKALARAAAKRAAQMTP